MNMKEKAAAVEAKKDTKALEAAQAKKEKEEYNRAFNTVAKTEAGKIMLHGIMRLCGYELPIFPRQQTLDQIAGNVNEGRRTVWLDIRQVIKRDRLMEIEYLKRK